MRSKVLTHFIRVRVSEDDHQFLESILNNTDVTISELLRGFVAKLRVQKSNYGKHHNSR
jgi:hypothetical protein